MWMLSVPVSQKNQLNSPWISLSSSLLHHAQYIFNRRQMWTAGRLFTCCIYEVMFLETVQNSVHFIVII